MTHHIRRQVLDLELPREPGAYALQQQFGQVFQEKVLPQLDKLFSELAPEGVVLRIPALEIDLGRLREQGWEEEFTERCVQQAKLQMQELLVRKDQELPATAAHWFSPANMALRILSDFLTSGQLPWYASDWTVRRLEEKLRIIIEEHPSMVAAEISPVLLEKTKILQRLHWQFSPPIADQLVEAVLALKEGWLSQARRQVERRINTTVSRKVWIQFQRVLPQALPSAARKVDPSAELITRLLGKAHIPTAERSADYSRPVEEAKQEQKKDDSNRPDSTLPTDSMPSFSRQADAAEPTGSSAATNTITDREHWPAAVAGLVLLGVYLNPFFEELELTRDKAFCSEAHQHRAVHLLYYLATGKMEAEEPVLLLPKLLCGMPLADPVPAQVDLFAAEIAECDNLLQAVVNNWSALKNTSPDGVRQGFLDRQGLLYPPEGRSQWELRVERQAQDLLLDRLPWGFAITKLPWMELPLQTEW